MPEYTEHIEFHTPREWIGCYVNSISAKLFGVEGKSVPWNIWHILILKICFLSIQISRFTGHPVFIWQPCLEPTADPVLVLLRLFSVTSFAMKKNSQSLKIFKTRNYLAATLPPPSPQATSLFLCSKQGSGSVFLARSAPHRFSVFSAGASLPMTPTPTSADRVLCWRSLTLPVKVLVN